MDISVISIGNSKGIRLSKTILEKYKIADEMELILEEDYMILKPKQQPRKDWEASFKKMREEADDQILFPDVFEDENLDSWN